MSDFLQFIDRIPSLPNRKKITHSDSSVEYATIEYADEPVEEGTFLNKANFNKLNAVLGYNEISGAYNPTTETAEFTTEIDLSNFKNNQRLLLQCISKVVGPATDFTLDKEKSISIGSSFSEVQMLKMSNRNIMVVSNGYMIILDQNGNEIKSKTDIGTSNMGNAHLIEMSNGNIMIVGGNSSYYVYYTIVNQQGQIIKSNTYTGLRAQNPNGLIEMSNGNILIIAYNYFIILDKQGNTIKSQTTLMGIGDYPQLVQMSNGNIFVVGGGSDPTYEGNIAILDINGNIVKSITSIGNGFRKPQAIKMSNDNIMIVGSSSNNQGTIAILNQSGNIVKSATNIYGGFVDPQLKEMSNRNILIIGNNSNTGYFYISSQTGQNIKSATSLGTYFGNPKLLEMSNGNIMIVGNYSSSNRLYVAIINKQGNIIKTSTMVGSGGNSYLQQLLEMDDGKIMIVNGTSSTCTITILIPISSGANASINSISLDTFLEKDKYYELVYNSTLNKFIAEEVRNAN